MNDAQDPTSGWEPEFTLDLGNATAQRFQELVEKFEESTKALGDNLPPLPFAENDWYSLNAQINEAILRRNRPESNRKLAFSTVQYYWRQMRDGLWKPTGQPLIFDVEGWLKDGQHRAWAGYLGEVAFDSYVIIDAPVIKNAFAYLDNVKARTPAAALQTAKFNGLSAVISRVIGIAHHYDMGAYTCYKTKYIPRLAPIQFLEYAEQHPLVKKAVRIVVADHKEAIEIIGHDDIAAFVGFKIISLYDEGTCEGFLEELAFPEETHSDNDAIRALRVFLAKQAKTKEPLPKHLILAHVIKAFNAWISGTPVKRISIHPDDPFPQFVAQEHPVAAEGEEAA